MILNQLTQNNYEKNRLSDNYYSCYHFMTIYHFSNDIPKLIKSVSLNNTSPIKELKKLELSKGDTITYKELSIAYLNVPY